MDIKILRTAGGSAPVMTWSTDAGDAAIKAGDPVKQKVAGSPYAVGLVDGDLTIGTDTPLVGIAKHDSNHTSSEDGTLEVYVPLPGIVYEAKATTPANLASGNRIGDRVTLDLTDGTYTIDENISDGANSAFRIVGFDAERGTVEFIIRADATILGA